VGDVGGGVGLTAPTIPTTVAVTGNRPGATSATTAKDLEGTMM
jgi:hypothetical protein